MAHDPKTRSKVRASYVQGHSLPEASAEHGVPYQTARNWMRADKAAGNDWDIARHARRMTRGGQASLTHEVLEALAEQFSLTLTQLKTAPDIDPMKRTELLLRLSDAYSKTMSAAARGNPKLDALSVAMDVLRELGAFIGEYFPDLRERMVEVMDAFGPHIVTKVASAAATGK